MNSNKNNTENLFRYSHLFFYSLSIRRGKWKWIQRPRIRAEDSYPPWWTQEHCQLVRCLYYWWKVVCCLRVLSARKLVEFLAIETGDLPASVVQARDRYGEGMHTHRPGNDCLASCEGHGFSPIEKGRRTNDMNRFLFSLKNLGELSVCVKLIYFRFCKISHISLDLDFLQLVSLPFTAVHQRI